MKKRLLRRAQKFISGMVPSHDVEFEPTKRLQFGNLSREEKLVYIHIPKTGGESIRHFLGGLFHGDEQIILRNPKRAAAVNPDDYVRAQLVFGHISCDMAALLPPNIKMATTLRHPFERVSSHFRHVLHRENSSLHEYVHEHGILTLRDFLHNHESKKISTNFMTNWLAKDVCLPERYCAQHGSLPHGGDSSRVPLLDDGQDPAEALDMAMSRLEQFDFIGIGDDFPRLMECLAMHYGLPVPADSIQVNKSQRSKGYSELDDETREILYERNRNDLRLYEYAQGRFEAISRQVAEDAQPRSGGAIVSSMKQADWQHGGAIDIHGPLGVGWSPVKGQDKGLAFRWSGPTKISLLMLPVPNNGSSRVTMTCGQRYPGTIDNLSIVINDRPVPLHREASKTNLGKFNEDISFTVTPDMIAEGEWPLRCEVRIAESFVPEEKAEIAGTYGRNYLSLYRIALKTIPADASTQGYEK